MVSSEAMINYPSVRDRLTTVGSVVVKNRPTQFEKNLLDGFTLKEIADAFNKHSFASRVFEEIGAANLLLNLPPARNRQVSLYRSYDCYQVPKEVGSPRDLKALHIADTLSLVFTDSEQGVSGRIGFHVTNGSKIGVVAKPKFGDIPPSDDELFSDIYSRNPLPPDLGEGAVFEPTVFWSVRSALHWQLYEAYIALGVAMRNETVQYPGGSLKTFLESPIFAADSKTLLIFHPLNNPFSNVA